MLSLEVFIALYLLVATFAAMMTYYEQVRTQNRDPLFSALGFVACLLWPVTLVAVTVAAQTQLLLHRA